MPTSVLTQEAQQHLATFHGSLGYSWSNKPPEFTNIVMIFQPDWQNMCSDLYEEDMEDGDGAKVGNPITSGLFDQFLTDATEEDMELFESIMTTSRNGKAYLRYFQLKLLTSTDTRKAAGLPISDAIRSYLGKTGWDLNP